jgi:hypothetical protein
MTAFQFFALFGLPALIGIGGYLYVLYANRQIDRRHGKQPR